MVFSWRCRAQSTEVMTVATNMKKCNFRLMLLLAFYSLFLILGAAIFSAIESPLEVAEVKNMRERKFNFLRSHTCLSGKSLALFFTISFLSLV